MTSPIFPGRLLIALEHSGIQVLDRDQRALLPKIKSPTLVIAGRQDAFTSWPQADRIAARMPHAEVVVFERSGHFPWIEEPDSFFDTVLGWLRSHDV